MKKVAFAAIVILAAGTAFAQNSEDRHQSYITYDSGGTTIHQSFDQSEIDGRINLPIFSGDQVQTSRGGRTEIRLADGNVVAIDGSSGIKFHSIYESYEGDSKQTLIELLFGEMIVDRVSSDGQPLRLDTPNATYVSEDFSLYSVDNEGDGVDRVAVFGGAVEIRTRRGTTRMRAGERGEIDHVGEFSTSGLARSAMNDFEQWYLRRADRYTGETSRYLSNRFSYADSDFDSYGSWVYVQDYTSWVWRPRVSVGWQPYLFGQWISGPSGCLVWVSDEPWGWIPYHYGRWAYNSLYGWIWVPGTYYSPAWVYWVYGPSYVGWVPAGWYDYYRPYYPWFRGHGRHRSDIGFGFSGRIRIGGRDLHGWVVVDSNHILSRRVDRAALTTDAIRHRLSRDGTAATFSNIPARFTGNERRDPATAVRTIARRGVGIGTGTERGGSPADMTDFFRRDPNLSTTTRDRIVRSVNREGTPVGTPGSTGRTRTVTPVYVGPERNSTNRGGVITRTPAAAGTPATRDRAVTRPSPGRESGTGVVTRPATGTTTGSSGRERTATPPSRTRTLQPKQPNREQTNAAGESWRVNRGAAPRQTGSPSAPATRSRGVVVPESRDSWRGGTVARPSESSSTRGEAGTSGNVSRDRGAAPAKSDARGGDQWRSTPVPRRVIESIGGSRVVGRDRPASSGSATSSRSRESSRPSSSSGGSTVRRPSSGSSSGSVRAPAPRRSSGSSSRSSKKSSSSHSSGSSHKVDRNRPH